MLGVVELIYGCFWIVIRLLYFSVCWYCGLLLLKFLSGWILIVLVFIVWIFVSIICFVVLLIIIIDIIDVILIIIFSMVSKVCILLVVIVNYVIDSVLWKLLVNCC